MRILAKFINLDYKVSWLKKLFGKSDNITDSLLIYIDKDISIDRIRFILPEYGKALIFIKVLNNELDMQYMFREDLELTTSFIKEINKPIKLLKGECLSVSVFKPLTTVDSLLVTFIQESD